MHGGERRVSGDGQTAAVRPGARASHRRWVIASVLFAMAVAAVCVTTSVFDRRNLLVAAEERTFALAQMIAAHADASISGAVRVLGEIEALTADGEYEDAEAGRDVFLRAREIVGGLPALSSAWIVDRDGMNRLDTWSYPPAPVSATDRPYWAAHRDSQSSEVFILGDESPGSLTGRRRFTISRARHDADGRLVSIAVVAVYSDLFDTLYEQAARWPGARGGLYNVNGNVLARMQNLPRAPQEFIDAMNANVRDAASGTEIINEPSGPRVASWTRLATFPILYSTSSQTVSAALAAWRLRTLGLGGVGVTAIVLFCLFAAKSARAARAEAEARFHAMALSEVHHRVKNSLTLVLAMVRLQRNQHKDPVIRAELDAVASRLLAVAETQSLLESARAADKIDAGQLLARLADEMSAQSGKTVRFASSCVAPIDNSVAASLAIIANELITNGLKHGRSTVDVNLASDAGGISLTVSSDGDALPEGFTIEGTDGFGLRMVKSVAEHSGGAFRVGNDAGRATFEVRLAAAG